MIYYHGALPVDMYYLVAKIYLYKKRLIHPIGDRCLGYVPGNMRGRVHDSQVVVCFPSYLVVENPTPGGWQGKTFEYLRPDEEILSQVTMKLVQQIAEFKPGSSKFKSSVFGSEPIWQFISEWGITIEWETDK